MRIPRARSSTSNANCAFTEHAHQVSEDWQRHVRDCIPQSITSVLRGCVVSNVLIFNQEKVVAAGCAGDKDFRSSGALQDLLGLWLIALVPEA